MTTITQAVADRDRERQDSNGTPGASLAIQPGQDFWTAKQQAALAVLGLKNVSNADLAVFLHYCQKTGLDPFSRQIYGIMRREKQGDQWVDKFTIQVGIDGFRVIRDRIAVRLGVTVEYEDSRWYDADGIAYEVWVRAEPPVACGMAVLRDGKRFPAVVRYSAFVQMRNGKPTSMWERMDAEQLEKCAEAKALRRAFPHDLGGIYLEEEMPPQPAAPRRAPVRVTVAEVIEDAPPQEPPPSEKAPSKTASEKLQRLIAQVFAGYQDHDVATVVASITGHPADEALTAADAKLLITTLEDALREAGGDTEAAAAHIWQHHQEAGDA